MAGEAAAATAAAAATGAAATAEATGTAAWPCPSPRRSGPTESERLRHVAAGRPRATCAGERGGAAGREAGCRLQAMLRGCAGCGRCSEVAFWPVRPLPRVRCARAGGCQFAAFRSAALSQRSSFAARLFSHFTHQFEGRGLCIACACILFGECDRQRVRSRIGQRPSRHIFADLHCAMWHFQRAPSLLVRAQALTQRSVFFQIVNSFFQDVLSGPPLRMPGPGLGRVWRADEGRRTCVEFFKVNWEDM